MSAPDRGMRAVLGRPFAEQIAAFRLRLGNLVPTSRWDDLRHEAHDRAFMVAGAIGADLLADLGRAVDRAITEGTGLEAFRQDFREIVARRGWHGWTGEGTAAGEAWRTRVIYRTNAATTYAAGRWAQLMEGGFPLLVYRHGGSREPRPQHLAWDGLILPADHPFWATHAPPNGWGCSCYVLGARDEAAARRLGGDPGKSLPANWNRPDARTGAPAGIDRGWAYAPGASAAETITLAARKLAELPARLGADLGRALAPQVSAEWPNWLQAVGSRRDHVPGLLGAISPTVLAALERAGISPSSAEIMVSPGIVAGQKARRHQAKGDALSDADWQSLPMRMAQPRAVLLDLETQRILYLVDGSGGPGQAAIALDFRLKARRGAPARATNMMVSAYRPNLMELGQRLAAGRLRLLMGRVE